MTLSTENSVQGRKDGLNDVLPSQRSKVNILDSILDFDNDTLQDSLSNEMHLVTQRNSHLSSIFHDAAYFSSFAATSFIAAGIATIVEAGEVIEDMVLGPKTEESLSKESFSISNHKSSSAPRELRNHLKLPCESDDDRTEIVNNGHNRRTMPSATIISEKAMTWQKRKENEKMKRETKVNAITKLHVRESRQSLIGESLSKSSQKKISELKVLPDITSIKALKRRERELKVSEVSELHLKKKKDDEITCMPAPSGCSNQSSNLTRKEISTVACKDGNMNYASKRVESLESPLQYHDHVAISTLHNGQVNRADNEIPFDEEILGAIGKPFFNGNTEQPLRVETDLSDYEERLQPQVTPHMTQSWDGKMYTYDGSTSLLNSEESIDVCNSQAEIIENNNLKLDYGTTLFDVSDMEDKIFDQESPNTQGRNLLEANDEFYSTGTESLRKVASTGNDQRDVDEEIMGHQKFCSPKNCDEASAGNRKGETIPKDSLQDHSNEMCNDEKNDDDNNCSLPEINWDECEKILTSQSEHAMFTLVDPPEENSRYDDTSDVEKTLVCELSIHHHQVQDDPTSEIPPDRCNAIKQYTGKGPAAVFDTETDECTEPHVLVTQNSLVSLQIYESTEKVSHDSLVILANGSDMGVLTENKVFLSSPNNAKISMSEFSQCVQDKKGKGRSSYREGNGLNKDCINDCEENNPTKTSDHTATSPSLDGDKVDSQFHSPSDSSNPNFHEDQIPPCMQPYPSNDTLATFTAIAKEGNLVGIESDRYVPLKALCDEIEKALSKEHKQKNKKKKEKKSKSGSKTTLKTKKTEKCNLEKTESELPDSALHESGCRQRVSVSPRGTEEERMKEKKKKKESKPKKKEKKESLQSKFSEIQTLVSQYSNSQEMVLDLSKEDKKKEKESKAKKKKKKSKSPKKERRHDAHSKSKNFTDVEPDENEQDQVLRYQSPGQIVYEFQGE